MHQSAHFQSVPAGLSVSSLVLLFQRSFLFLRAIYFRQRLRRRRPAITSQHPDLDQLQGSYKALIGTNPHPRRFVAGALLAEAFQLLISYCGKRLALADERFHSHSFFFIEIMYSCHSISGTAFCSVGLNCNCGLSRACTL